MLLDREGRGGAGCVAGKALVGLCVALLAVGGLVGAGPAPAQTGSASGRACARDSTEMVELVLRIVDGATGLPVNARCCATDLDETPCCPGPVESFFYRQPYGDFAACFFSCGECTLHVPVGHVALAVSKGFEYEAVLDTVEINRDSCVVCTLSRWTDMADEGWYSGDCHVHIHHTGGVYDVCPEDARFISECEGLNVINCLDCEYCFTGGPDPCSTPECIVYMVQEKRSRVYGHSGFLGISSLVLPTSYSIWWPMIMDMADEVHEQPGAIVVCAHPMSTPNFYDIDSVGGMMLARELPIDVIRGKVDAYEVLSRERSNHRRNVEMWYHVLNCGFRLPGVAGTDACVNVDYGNPAGSYKSYVKVAGEFTYDSWLQGLAEGRTFATNGPLVTEFSVEGLTMGDSLDFDGVDSMEIGGSISVECSTPLLRADIMVNGEVDQTLFPEGDATEIEGDFSVTLDKSAWIAAKVVGVKEHCFTSGDSLWAHTGPVYFTLNGERIVEVESADCLARWVARMETLAVSRGEWGAPSDSSRVMAELAFARSYYEALADGVMTGVDGGDSEDQASDDASAGRPDARTAFIAPNRPNPFVAATTIPFFVPQSGDAALQILAPSGRLVRTLLSTDLPEGWHTTDWDGRDERGLQCGAGIYFCRLAAGGSVARRRMVLLR